MGKIYGVFHGYDVDGGFGDAVYCEDPVFFTTSESEAEAWAEKWSTGEVYDKPYAELTKNNFEVREFDLLDTVDINKRPKEFPGYYNPCGYDDEEEEE